MPHDSKPQLGARLAYLRSVNNIAFPDVEVLMRMRHADLVRDFLALSTALDCAIEALNEINEYAIRISGQQDITPTESLF